MRRVVITGASSGIGKATADLLLASGHQVYGLCRSVDRLSDGVIGVECDLKDEKSVRAAFESIKSESGEIDVLINNAGVALLSKISDGDLADWDEMWQVNVRGLALCCQLSLDMLNKRRGQIVNVSSMSGHRVPATGGFYAPTKFAVRAVTEALRGELKQMHSSIRVASISPGFVDTPLLDSYFKGRNEVLQATKQQMKMLKAEDIAESIVHILNTPMHVEIGDVQLRSVDQKS